MPWVEDGIYTLYLLLFYLLETIVTSCGLPPKKQFNVISIIILRCLGKV
jgi:hypothetical protein